MPLNLCGDVGGRTLLAWANNGVTLRFHALLTKQIEPRPYNKSVRRTILS